jgi:hypothetical protein
MKNGEKRWYMQKLLPNISIMSLNVMCIKKFFEEVVIVRPSVDKINTTKISLVKCQQN